MAITHLSDVRAHDAAIERAHSGTPTVLYVSFSPTPACKMFTPQYEKLAADGANEGVVFYQMEYEKETSPMMKFGPQHMPIVIVIVGYTAKTLLSPRIGQVVEAMKEVFGAKK